MAIAKSTLNQLFAWCPLGQQRHLAASERRPLANVLELPATGSQLAERPTSVVHRTMAPDLRQCEPWRQATLLDAAARNDPEQHKRLTR